MTALAAARGFRPRTIRYFQFVLANGIVAYPGAAVFWDPVNGVATIGSTAVGLRYLGRCAEDLLPITGNGTTTKVNVDLGREVELTYFANGTSSDAITSADLFNGAYALDDQTVSRLPTGKSYVGQIWDVDPTYGIGVDRATTVLGQNLSVATSFPAPVAGTITVTAAQIVNGAIYDVPTLAANTTVVLPAGAPDGVIIYAEADGVKNGSTFTTQYQDATGSVNLTAALTAQKRHGAVFTKIAGKWICLGVNTAP